MATRTGLDAQLGYSSETTYGTYVAPTKFIEFISETMGGGAESVRKVYSGGLGRGLGRRANASRTQPASVSGGVVVEVGDRGLQGLLAHVFGAPAAPTTTNVDSTTYSEWTYKWPPANGNQGRSFSMQIGKPGVGGTVHPFNYLGCKVTGWEISAEIDAAARLSLEVFAQSLDIANALVAASFDDSLEYFFQDAALSVGSQTLGAIRSITMSGVNALNTERRGISQGLPLEPLANGEWELTGNLDGEFIDLALLNAWRDGTQAVLTLNFASRRVTSRTGFSVRLPAIEYTGSVPQVGGPDIVRQALPFKALAPASGADIGVLAEVKYESLDTSL